MLHFPLPPFVVLAVLICTPLATAAQQPHGGRLDSFHQFSLAQGESDLPVMAPAGDRNGDGYDDLLIGHPYDSSSGTDESGMVQLISGVDYSILHTWFGAKVESEFGLALTLTGDVNGDGMPDVAIGAPNEIGNGQFETGAVYLYSSQPPYALINRWEGDANGDGFGSAVVDAGDLNGDGRSDLLIGSPWADANSGSYYDVGKASLYSGVDPQASGLIMQWEGGFDAYELGSALLAPGDMTGDGVPDLVIGIPGSDSNPWIWFEGQVIVVSGADGSTVLEFWGEESGDGFGTSLANAGDLDQDGVPDLLIGAPQSDLLAGVYDNGSVFLVSGATGDDLMFWIGQGKFDWFGYSIDTGDVNGDGVNDILIGAPLMSLDGLTNRGGFYAYSGTDFELLLFESGVAKNQVLGAGLRYLGDINNDGFQDLGTPFFDWSIPFSPSGSAYLYSTEIIPQMSASANSISNTTGGTVQFYLDFPDEAGLYDYRMLYSGTGMGPVNIMGLPVPLSYDLNLVNSYLGNYPPALFTPTGILNQNGDGTAKLSIPAGGIPPGIINSTFYFATICKLAWGNWEYSSVALPITFNP
jgi:FG-GAP repeat protein